ncbi:Pol polyprotein, partial [Mucuna pruriens]
MDILGSFPMAKGQVKFLLVDVDYFTKWIEAEPLATITTQKVQRFVWQNIICRHGIPNSMVTDNGTQFVNKSLREVYEELQITHRVTSVEHLLANSQAKATNKVILGELRTDVMIPVEIGEPSLRRSSFDLADNSSSLWTALTQ